MRVRTWESGGQFLDGAEPDEIDCLVLDCKMPDLDGFGVIRALADRQANLPVILITAPVTDALRRLAVAAGALSVLEKPLADGILAATVRDAIGC